MTPEQGLTDRYRGTQSGPLHRWIIRWKRLGFTDVYHENVRRRGILGRLYVLLFGTPHLGNFANGFYLRRVLHAERFRTALDAGCGDGTFAFYLASNYPDTRVVGVDIGEQGLHSIETTLDICDRIQTSLTLPNVQFQRMDLRHLTFENEFDLIFSFDVLEHIAENKQVLEKMYGALRPGGLLLIRIPTRVQKRLLSRRLTAEHEKWAKIEHLGQHYEKDSLIADLRGIGFENISFEYTMGFWGRLSFELSEAMKTLRFPDALQFGLTPVLKLFRVLDTLANAKQGDGLLASCRK